MKKTRFLGIVFFILLFSWACREDFNYESSVGKLTFSKDTVFLDTVFKGISSSTYSLKVYNSSTTNIRIPTINLKNGTQSQYRLNVNGSAGNSFTDVPLLAKDSLFVFIETTVTDTSEEAFLYTDALQFGQEGNYQEIPLVTLVKEARFIYAETTSTKRIITIGQDENGNPLQVEGFVLKDNQLDFDNTLPYVIYGYAIVPEEKQLQIAAGSRLHFHANSGLYIAADAQLTINGTLSEDLERQENEVVFEGDRLESEFSYVAGQWGGIVFDAGSRNNTINHLTLKNPQIGITLLGTTNNENPSVQLENSQIHNASFSNVLSLGSGFTAINSVFGNAGASSVWLQKGGNYSFTHCTLANYWSTGFRTQPTVVISSIEDGVSYPLSLTFDNSIIDGNAATEIGINVDWNTLGVLKFNHTSIKTASLDLTQELSVNDTTYFTNPILNPLITYQNLSKFLFWPQEDSETIDQGDPRIAADFPTDIMGTSRTSTPDLGAKEKNP